MTTRRETILDAVVTALAGTTNVGTRIYRSRVTAFTREETPSLLVTWDSDNPVQTTSLPKLDWTLDISIAVILAVGNFFESSIAIQPEPVPRSKILFLSFNFEIT